MASLVAMNNSTKKKRKLETEGHENIIVKPASDKKNYKKLTLTNGLQVILISDPTQGAETKEIGVAMSVGVGSFSDPKDRQGLAHLLEHM